MASVARWLLPSRKPAANQPTEHTLTWYGHLLGALALSLPFLGLSLVAEKGLFLNPYHARLVARALVAIDRNRPEWLITSYPPLSFILALIIPSPLTLNLATALLAGATVWALWNELMRAPMGLVARLTLLAALIATPAWTFLATQSLSSALTLCLLFLAWRNLYDSLVSGRVWSSFSAGMLLGLAFYAGFYALAFGLLCALAVPCVASIDNTISAKERREALMAKTIVIAFPLLMALASWAYLNWVADGDPWRFLRDPLSGTLAYLNRDAPPMTGLPDALRGTGHELLRLPLYLSVGLLVALKAPKWLSFYLVPIVSATLLRALGFYVSEALLLSMCSMTALAALCRWPSKPWQVFLTLAALLQIALHVALPSRDHELMRWRTFLNRGEPFEAEAIEAEVAAHLRRATPHSILADDNDAYRLIARTGTARPFILPGDATFELALSDPLRRAKYLLSSAEEGNLSAAFGEMPPAGFVLEATWPGWQLYRSQAALPLLSSAPLTQNLKDKAAP